ncbi:CheR family methyltransferase [Bacillus marasmi]|uniref:CheR family methyltransferase n=1 Tax=Bacillus marasmi TaxID=1926279 RepID=UPI001FED18D0|nr:protein-glutamate O-methyltransferase CheR [Bacillus marasmi]
MFITDKEFQQLAYYIEYNYGIHLRKEKKTLVEGRLYNYIKENNMSNFSEFYQRLIQDKTNQTATNLVNKITTNHTFFMRETDHFDYFRDIVLPYLSESVKDKDLRIWSAGCSTGEEPYTLAMIINDYFKKEKLFWDTKILATDISDKVLKIARDGQYSNGALTKVPPTWRTNYFEHINKDTSEITKRVRDEVIFRRLNLMDKVFPFKKRFHVIFCRNVMIYFKEQTKMELVNKLYQYTEPGGYLFIGHSESLNRERTAYQYIKPAIFRKM